MNVSGVSGFSYMQRLTTTSSNMQSKSSTLNFRKLSVSDLEQLLTRAQNDAGFRNQFDPSALTSTVRTECDRLIDQMAKERKAGSLTPDRVRANLKWMMAAHKFEDAIAHPNPVTQEEIQEFCSRPVDTTRFTRVGSAVSLHLTDASKVGLDVYA